jgi:hypothetical protein
MSIDRPSARAAGDPAAWEAVELEARKPAGVALSVRMPADLYARIERYAADNSKTVSEVIREAADALVSGQPARPSAVTLTATAGVTFILNSPQALLRRVTSGATSAWQRISPPA